MEKIRRPWSSHRPGPQVLSVCATTTLGNADTRVFLTDDTRHAIACRATKYVRITKRNTIWDNCMVIATNTIRCQYDKDTLGSCHVAVNFFLYTCIRTRLQEPQILKLLCNFICICKYVSTPYLKPFDIISEGFVSGFYGILVWISI